MQEIARLETEKLRSVKMCSGTSGSLRLRACRQTKRPMIAIPPTTRAQVRTSQPRCSPFCRPKTRQNIPTPLSPTPSQSKTCGWVSSSGTSSQLSTIATTPIGTLTKKIHSQPPAATSAPPASGPTSVAMPAVAPHSAIAAPRRSGGKMRVMVAIVCGVIIAAPRP